MADDELRKGQRRAVACVDLLYIGRKKKRRHLLHRALSSRFSTVSPPLHLLRDSVGLHDVVRLEVLGRHVRKSLLRKYARNAIDKVGDLELSLTHDVSRG